MVQITPLVAFSIVALLSGIALLAQCTGQSCYIATLSGSTDQVYQLPKGKQVAGGNSQGTACIKGYYEKLGLTLPPGVQFNGNVDRVAAFNGIVSPETIARRMPRGEAGLRSLESEEENSEAELEKRQAPGACKPHTMIYARGTLESGALGFTVGPLLSNQLDQSWSVQGITSADGYPADLNGNYCVGLPGGMACKTILEKLSVRCPNTKVILAGYSQGAMVARICAAYANETARKQVKGLLLYGDPMNGATVKGIPSNKIKTICHSADGVCTGEFSISAAHLSYYGSDITQGITFVKQVIDA